MNEETVVADDVKSTEEQTDPTLTTDEAVVETDQAVEQESVYKKENARLEAEARQKAGALKEEREKRKAAEKAAEALVKANEEDKKNTLSSEDVDKLLEEKLAKRDFEQQLSQMTIDPEEQKLIRTHYENSIKRTGSVTADLKMAAAIANEHLIEKAKSEEMERNQTEAFTTRFSGPTAYSRPGKPAYETDPSLKRAASLLEKIGAKEAIKHLGK